MHLETVDKGTSDYVHIPQLWEAVAERMRAEILSGALAAGSKLIETELAERFGTSRGPVREAFRELARDGLVAEIPRRGTVVLTLSARDLAEVYGVREALEVGASKTLITRVADEELRLLDAHVVALEEAPRPGADYLEAAQHDFAFHRDLVALARNDRMTAMNEQMIAQTALLLRTAAQANPTLRTEMDRPVHREMLDALSARDVGRSSLAIEAHYRYAEERLFGRFALERWRPTSP